MPPQGRAARSALPVHRGAGAALKAAVGSDACLARALFLHPRCTSHDSATRRIARPRHASQLRLARRDSRAPRRRSRAPRDRAACRAARALGSAAERLLAKDDARLAGLDARALVTAQSDGFVMCNIALRGGARELGIGCSNLWLQPCASETGGSIERGIAEYLAAPLGVDATQVPLMLTFPSVKDHGWHVDHPEHTMCQTLALAPWTWFERHRVPGADAPPRHAPPSVPRAEPAEYEALKAKWAERCVRMLSAHYPRTNGRVEFVNVSTPLTIENYLPSGAGSAIGLDVTPARFVDLDEIGRLDMRTRVSGLWLTGQDVLMCGQPLAQLSGIITAVRICGPLRTAGLAWRVLLQQLGLLG